MQISTTAICYWGFLITGSRRKHLQFPSKQYRCIEYEIWMSVQNYVIYKTTTFKNGCMLEFHDNEAAYLTNVVTKISVFTNCVIP